MKIHAHHGSLAVDSPHGSIDSVPIVDLLDSTWPIAINAPYNKISTRKRFMSKMGVKHSLSLLS